MAWYGFQIAVLFIRGPHVQRYTWVGWEGGWQARKSVVDARRNQLVGQAEPIASEGVSMTEHVPRGLNVVILELQRNCDCAGMDNGREEMDPSKQV